MSRNHGVKLFPSPDRRLNAVGFCSHLGLRYPGEASSFKLAPNCTPSMLNTHGVFRNAEGACNGLQVFSVLVLLCCCCRADCVWNQTGSRQADGLKESSRWLGSAATTPPDYDRRHRQHPEGMQDFGPCRDGRVRTISYLRSL